MNEEPEAVKGREKVLIVEDDADIREMYQRVLERAGYEVAMATNGRDGLEKAIGERPDLVLLDIVFLPPEPEQPDGFAVLASIRTEPATQGIPVIVLTGPRDDPTHVKRGMELGATAYLVKHQTGPKKVLEVCQEALKGKAGEK